MKQKTLLIAAFGAATFLFYSCKTQTVAPAPLIACAEPVPTFSGAVKELIDKNCASTCHSSKNRVAGIDLSTYEHVKAIAGKKKFLGALRHNAGFAPMPKKAPKLSDADITKIACWIQGGSVL